MNGCWECSEFPCTGCMFDKPRIRAFAEFARRYGVDELEKCLLRNKEKGIVYHYEGQLVGDYDKCQTEEEIIEMIKGCDFCSCDQPRTVSEAGGLLLRHKEA